MSAPPPKPSKPTGLPTATIAKQQPIVKPPERPRPQSVRVSPGQVPPEMFEAPPHRGGAEPERTLPVPPKRDVVNGLISPRGNNSREMPALPTPPTRALPT